jgi:uncharacterized protein (TIRG00374 family)
MYDMFADDILSVKVHFDPWSFVMAILLVFVSIIPRVYRWLLLMRTGDDGVSISFWDSFKITLVGLALNIVSPGGSGDILKSYYGYQWTGIKERMVAISLYDKLIAVLSLGIIAGVGFLYSFSWNYILASVICIGVFFILTNRALIIWVSKKKLVERLNNKTFKLNFDEFSASLKFPFIIVFWTILLSLFAWLIDFIFLYYCFQWSGLVIEFNEVLFNGAVLKLGKLFPFTLNGMGTDELIMGYLFASVKSEIGLVLVSSLIYRLMIDIVPALVGVVFMVAGKKQKNKKNKKTIK